jgi:hypothetical protein
MRMAEHDLPEGLVLWPAGLPDRNRLCVLISDIHCTDCTVGNQTASETDWEMFFAQLKFAVSKPGDTSHADSELEVKQLILILNGDIVDLIRSGRWAQAGVYPWDRNHPDFEKIVLEIMEEIVRIHANRREPGSEHPYSGFFYWMKLALQDLRNDGVEVVIVPIVGNHDKELQVVPAARQIFYEQCLGLDAFLISESYRDWVARQLGTDPNDMYPCLPFYFADPGLRMLATHGQWRDPDNARATQGWNARKGWTPATWRRERYLPFSEPCFGDTVAAGMLSHFIWNTRPKIDPSLKGGDRIRHLLDEMDLYRPSVKAVVRLLREANQLAQQYPEAKGLNSTVLSCFRDSLEKWLAHEVTLKSASGKMKLRICMLKLLTRLKWHWLDLELMRAMAEAQEPPPDIPDEDLFRLPAFRPEYRALGLRLHVEGHTHVALEADLQFQQDAKGRNNYTYVNLGAWRDAILPKRNRGYRRRGIGRALFVFDLAKLGNSPDAYRFYTRDIVSWGDRLDRW